MSIYPYILYSMTLKYSFNKQISTLCQKICYKSFGINLTPSPTQTPPPSLSPSLSHKQQISQHLYNNYRIQNFRYADKGITPKSLAQQMQVHLKRQGDIDWQIDSFGNFIFIPTHTYIHRVRKQVINDCGYSHLLVREVDGMLGQSMDTYWFDYFVDQGVNVSQIRRLVMMEFRARVLEQINCHRVVRTVVVGDSRSKQISERIANLLFGTRKYQIQKLESFLPNSQNPLKPHNFRYISCNGQNSIRLQKRLPHHTLLTKFIGYEPTRISELSSAQLKKVLLRRPSGLMEQNYLNSLPNSQLVIKQLIENEKLSIFYGNLLDEHRLKQIQDILEYGDGFEKKGEEFNAIKQGHKRLFKLYFQ